MMDSRTIGKATPHSSGTGSRASSLASVVTRLRRAERWRSRCALTGSAVMAVMLLLLS